MSSHKGISSEEVRIDVSAHRLAVRFTDDSNLPARYRRSTDSSKKVRKTNDDSDIEKRFRTEVKFWADLIETMLGKIDVTKAWRYIDVSPQFVGPINQVTDCSDFCDFLEYLRQRRDVEQCGHDELGGLAILSIAIQREVEKQIVER